MDKAEFQRLVGSFNALSERELFIVATAYLDDIVKEMLEKRLPGNEVASHLSLFYKVKLARSVGILPDAETRILLDIIRIRNKFAHDKHASALQNSKVVVLMDEILGVFKTSTDPETCGFLCENDDASVRIKAELILGVMIKDLAKLIAHIKPIQKLKNSPMC